jgi:hypothetical protein
MVASTNADDDLAYTLEGFEVEDICKGGRALVATTRTVNLLITNSTSKHRGGNKGLVKLGTLTMLC